jgi:hypothetical protein
MNAIDCLWARLLEHGKVSIPMEVDEWSLLIKFHRICKVCKLACSHISLEIYKRVRRAETLEQFKHLRTLDVESARYSQNTWNQRFLTWRDCYVMIKLSTLSYFRSSHELVCAIFNYLGSGWLCKSKSSFSHIIMAIDALAIEVQLTVDYFRAHIDTLPSLLLDIVLTYFISSIRYNLQDHLSANAKSIWKNGYCSVLTCTEPCFLGGKRTFSGESLCKEHYWIESQIDAI